MVMSFAAPVSTLTSTQVSSSAEMGLLSASYSSAERSTAWSAVSSIWSPVDWSASLATPAMVTLCSAPCPTVMLIETLRFVCASM